MFEGVRGGVFWALFTSFSNCPIRMDEECEDLQLYEASHLWCGRCRGMHANRQLCFVSVLDGGHKGCIDLVDL